MAISISYDSRLIGDVTRDDIFNTPVGSCQDLNENIWCADTGNSRVLIYDSTLDQLLGEISDLRALTHPLPLLCPGKLNMPFRMARHSGNKWIYLTDIGNCCILVLDYSAGYGCDDLKVKLVFQQPADAPCIIHPNGIAFGTYNGRNYVAVADEFRHDGNPDKRNRICLYDEDGSYSGRFESVTNGLSAIDLYWPQGLAADSDGLLYICNVGYGVMHDPASIDTATVVRCQPTAAGTGVPFPNSHYPSPYSVTGAMISGFSLPRSVAVVNKHLYVADMGPKQILRFDIRSTPQEPYLVAYSTGGASPSVAPAYSNAGTERLVVTSVGCLDPVYKLSTSRLGLYDAWPLDHPLNPVNALTTAHAIVSDRSEPHRFYGVAASAAGPLQGGAQILLFLDQGNQRLQWIADSEGSTRDTTCLPLDTGSLHPVAPAGLRFWAEGTGNAAAGYLFVTDLAFMTGTGGVYIYQITLPFNQFTTLDLVGYLPAPKVTVNTMQVIGNAAGLDLRPVENNASVLLYVSHPYGATVSVWQFTPGNPLPTAPLYSVGELGRGPGSFWVPSDVAVIPSGSNATLFVNDMYNNRVQQFTCNDSQKTSKLDQIIGLAGGGTGGGQAGSPVFCMIPSGIGISKDANGNEDDLLVIYDLVNRSVKLCNYMMKAPPGPPPGTQTNLPNLFLGADPGQFWWMGPANVAIYPSSPRYPGLRHRRKLAIPDCYCNRVERFSYQPS